MHAILCPPCQEFYILFVLLTFQLAVSVLYRYDRESMMNKMSSGGMDDDDDEYGGGDEGEDEDAGMGQDEL